MIIIYTIIIAQIYTKIAILIIIPLFLFDINPSYLYDVYDVYANIVTLKIKVLCSRTSLPPDPGSSIIREAQLKELYKMCDL